MTGASLMLGYGLKANCNDKPWNGRQWSTLCANDIAVVYSVSHLESVEYPPDSVEYPALVVLLVGGLADVATSATGFMQLNAIVAAVAGFTTAALLARLRPGWRPLIFALGPPLVFYAFQNWDLLAVALVVGALYLLLDRQHPFAAGVSLGLGAAVKVFPALLLPALILAVRAPGRRFRPGPLGWRVAAGFVAGLAVPNVVLYGLSREAWKYFFTFQAERFPNPETSWFLAFRHLSGSPFVDASWNEWYPSLVNGLSVGMFLVIGGWIVVRESSRPAVRPYRLALAITATFLLTVKVFSPQYMLWLLPFLVLVELRVALIMALFITDFAVLAAINWYYLALYRGWEWPRVLNLLELSVWARYAILIWLIVECLRENRHEASGLPDRDMQLGGAAP
jgi:hypothetical protein